MGCAYGSRRIKKDRMKRIDCYVTAEQFEKLNSQKEQGISRSFLIRKALDLFFKSEERNDDDRQEQT
jgi:hypothetical protein